MNGLISSTYADVRIEPDQRSELHSQLLLGDIVQIKERRGNWCRCTLFDQSSGWVHCGYLVEKESSLQKYSAADLLLVTATAAHVYQEPNGSSQVIRPISVGTRIASIHYSNKWYRVEMPDGTRGWLYGYFTTPLVSHYDFSAAALLAQAKKLMGIPYLWGGASSFGLDCSGFTQLLHRMFEIILPRNSSQQVESGKSVADSLDSEDISEGDLLFFASGENVDHVGLATGDGTMIHAALGNGQVGINAISKPESAYESKLRDMFVCARRINQ